MAGEWIPVDIGIGTKPEVLELAEITGEPVAEIVFRMVQLWGWFSLNSADGTAAITPRRIAGICGGDESFWLAVESVGWIKFGKKIATVPKWDERFSKAAKARAQTNRRVAKHRSGKKPEKNGGCNAGVTVERYKCNGGALQGGNGGAYTRGEERRGEDKTRERDDSPSGESRRDGLKPAPPGTPDDDFNEFLPNLEKGATPETADAPTRPGEAARRPTRAKRVYRIGWDAKRAFTGLTEADRKTWESAYPAVNIDRALAAAHAWLIANPLKAKKSNWGAFINRWLSREQDRGGDAASNRAGPTVRTADERSRCWRDDALANMTQSAYDRWRVERGMLPEGEQMALNAKRAAAKRAENLAARTGGTGNEFLQIRRPDAG